MRVYVYKYIWSTNTFEVHIHLKYKYIWGTNTFEVQIHLRHTYIWNTNTFEVQIHLRYTYIWSTNTFEVQIHLKYKYIWGTHTFEVQIHLKYKCIRSAIINKMPLLGGIWQSASARGCLTKYTSPYREIRLKSNTFCYYHLHQRAAMEHYKVIHGNAFCLDNKCNSKCLHMLPYRTGERISRFNSGSAICRVQPLDTQDSRHPVSRHPDFRHPDCRHTSRCVSNRWFPLVKPICSDRSRWFFLS